ncbi:hypothetical protein [Nocardioides albus]|uniref:DUF3800 domain-containing protein n=1 Tax=Nocardioides albus TaxID=1841 RepID=A0A7W5A5S9_9ACTN|nr:hypothetical protein [Nocardioides albus]MBB3090241.1 hypothetical protein [Nocardioides albus]
MNTEQPDFVLHAWVDESIHVDAGFYLLAASIADPRECDAHRDAVRAAAPSVRRRIHWREEEHKDRLRIAEAFSYLDVAHTIVVASPIDAKKQERARRKCLERLLHELETLGVTRAKFESRTQPLNRRDTRMVDSMRGAGALTGKLRVEFEDPNLEPMLWIPDAVAGAVGADRLGVPGYRQALSVAIDAIELDL